MCNVVDEIRTLLPDLLRRRLSDIIQSENLRATGIQVERCLRFDERDQIRFVKSSFN